MISGHSAGVKRAPGAAEVESARIARAILFTILPAAVTYAIQSYFWSSLSPFAWFLFYPSVFISSWFGGFAGGLGATLLSAVLVWWSFLPPEGSFRIEDPKYIVSTAAYVSMGLAFSVFHERLRRSRRAEALALADIARANESLKQTLKERQIFAALIDNSADFIGIADATGRPTYVNPAGRRMVGLAPDHPVEQTQIPDYYPPEQRSFASGVIVKSMIEKGHWQGETYFRHWQTEQAIPVSDHHFMIRDPETGQALGMGTITRDISDIQRAREAASEKEARFQALVNASAQIVWTTDPSGAVVEDSPSWRAFTGQTFDALKGSGWLDAVHPDDRDGISARWADAVRTKTALNAELRIRHVSGDWRWTSVRGVPLSRSGGSLKEWVGMNSDITERKRREDRERFLSEVASLLASTIDYERTLSAVTSLVVRDLADCCIIDLVEEGGKVQRLKVAHRDPAKARVAEVLQRIPLDPRRPHLASPVLDTQQPLSIDQVTPEYLASIAQSEEHLRALRDLAPQSLLAIPLMAHGRLLGALILINTGQTRPHRQDDLALVREVADRAALAVHNARLYWAAQRATAARDEVLGIVAHDLRNPLNAIMLQAALLRRATGATDGDWRASAESIHRSASRMNRLIEDLLDVRRMEAGHLSVRPSSVSVEQVVRDAAEAQWPGVSAAGLEMTFDVTAGLPTVSVDRDRLLQVFENLVGNAVKFTPPNGRLTLGASRRGEEIVCWVQDTGPGIPSEELAHVFDRFWQARKGERGGVGLGLSIVKSLVEAHGGRVWVESAPESGTTFYFTLPIATPQPVQVPLTTQLGSVALDVETRS